MSNVWVVEEMDYDSQEVLAVFKSRRAMLDALYKRFDTVNINYSVDGLPLSAYVWSDNRKGIATDGYLLLTKYTLDKWRS